MKVKKLHRTIFFSNSVQVSFFCTPSPSDDQNQNQRVCKMMFRSLVFFLHLELFVNFFLTLFIGFRLSTNFALFHFEHVQ